MQKSKTIHFGEKKLENLFDCRSGKDVIVMTPNT